MAHEGEDEGGKYDSYIDKWDFDIPGKKLIETIYKPPIIYGRIYKDESIKYAKAEEEKWLNEKNPYFW